MDRRQILKTAVAAGAVSFVKTLVLFGPRTRQ